MPYVERLCNINRRIIDTNRFTVANLRRTVSCARDFYFGKNVFCKSRFVYFKIQIAVYR